MTYLKFWWRRTLKNPVSWVVLGFVVVLVGIIWAANARENPKTLLFARITSEQRSTQKSLKQARASLAQAKPGSERAVATQDTIDGFQAELKRFKAERTALDRGDYQAVYTKEIGAIAQRIKIAKDDGTQDADYVAALKIEQARLRTLKAANLPELSNGYPADGWGFLIDVNTYFMPVLLGLALVFMLTSGVAERFFGRLDTGRLIPLGVGNINDADALAASVLTLTVAAGFNGVIFVFAGLFGGFGAWQYPVFAMQPGTDTATYVAGGPVVVQAAAVSALSLLFMALAATGITVVLKNRFVALFTALVVLIGLPTITQLIQPLANLAQWLPTTYLFAVRTTTGQLAAELHNFAVTPGMGLAVLVCSDVLLAVGLHWLGRARRTA